MSYLQKKDGTPKFSEAIISFWFRVPSESLDAANKEYDNSADPWPVFNGIIPLLVLGEEGRDEGKYMPGKVVVSFTWDFKTQGPFYDTYAEYLGEECHSWHDFHFVYDFHCCLTATRTTRYTAVKIGDGADEHREEYSWVFPTDQKPEQKLCPTCIGVDVDGYLYVNFQTAKQPSVTGDEGYEATSSITPGHSYSTSGNIGYSYGDQLTHIVYDGGLLGCVGLVASSTVEGPTHVPGITGEYSYTPKVETKSNFPPLPYESGKVYSGGLEARFGNRIEVSPDKWHHVLVSVKLQTIKSHNYVWDGERNKYGYEGGSLLYIALDDKNYTKEKLTTMWEWGGEENNLGPNEVFSDMAWDVATDSYDPERHTQITYTLTEPQVPAGFIGLPAVDTYVDKIKRVELAELQIWFGQSFDTEKEENRRLFIDENGKPVKIEDKKAEDKLGKPDVLLHGSSNWKRGINKGTLAPSADTGTPSPWFTPVPADGIERWKPDPSLYGPQSPGQNPAAPQGDI